MAVIQINRQPSRRDLKVFGWILAVVFAGVGAWLWWRAGLRTSAVGTWIVGGALVVAYLALPALRRPLYVGWICAFYPLGWLLSHVALAVVYYVVLTPIGLVRRLVGGDPLRRRFDRDADTYWIERAKPPDKASYLRPF
jgi:protein-S-isoprenylcysteine O-methyltransferase Ste14